MKTYLLILLFVILANCQTFIEAEDENLPPINPEFYTVNWLIFTTNSTLTPPLDNLKEGEYRFKGNGTTYYDWSKRSMLEDYHDFCVPIFEKPNRDFHFPCKFLNTGKDVIY